MYKVTAVFSTESTLVEEEPVASFRRSSDGGGGWSLRLKEGYLHVSDVIVYPIFDASSSITATWVYDTGRHELHINNAVVAITGGSLELLGADKLYEGEDPQMPGVAFTGVASVTVEGSP